MGPQADFMTGDSFTSTTTKTALWWTVGYLHSGKERGHLVYVAEWILNFPKACFERYQNCHRAFQLVCFESVCLLFLRTESSSLSYEVTKLFLSILRSGKSRWGAFLDLVTNPKYSLAALFYYSSFAFKRPYSGSDWPAITGVDVEIVGENLLPRDSLPCKFDLSENHAHPIGNERYAQERHYRKGGRRTPAGKFAKLY